MKGKNPRIVALAVLAFAVACASSPFGVSVRERGDFSQTVERKTWDWGPYVDSTDEDRPQFTRLDRQFTRLVADALAQRGFLRSESAPDFRVAYQTSETERSVRVEVPRAPYLLLSFHSEGAFLIEGTDVEHRVFQEVHLAIFVTEGRGDNLWQASAIVPVESGDPIPLEEAVERLFDRFPLKRSH